jgi:chemotaxis response regulator CheB
MTREFINRVFAAVDTRIASNFMEFLAPDVIFVYGNQAPVVGLEHIKGMLEQFNASVKSMNHDIVGAFQCKDVWAVETKAHYEDLFGRHFVFPACNLITVRDRYISVYKIFVDNSVMWQPPMTAGS